MLLVLCLDVSPFSIEYLYQPTHILLHSPILESPFHRSTKIMKKTRRIDITNPLILQVLIQYPECAKVNKRLTEKTAGKCKEPYASVMTYIRTKLRFGLLRSTLAAVRGFRGKRNDANFQDLPTLNSV